jgi:Prolyl-tRNA synthetase
MDESGAIVWPAAFAPFEYYVIAGNVKKSEELQLAEAAYRLIVESGRSALLDDRSERIGSKFIDCELLGIRGVVVAGKLASQGLVEVRDRKSGGSCEAALEELLDKLY